MSIQLQPFTLDANAAAAIAATMKNSPVSLAALDCNWGPPVSGRFDTDFLQAWACAQTALKPKSVTLEGAKDDSDWNIRGDFSPVQAVGDLTLYFLSMSYGFPNQFVIRMETEDGAVYCDNNGGYGVNYRLKSYGGRVTSAVAGNPGQTGAGAPHGAIWLLPRFTGYRLVAQTGAE